MLRDIQDEPSAIWALISQLEPNLSLITYNGRSFDIPYIKQRLAYYGLDAPLDNPHFDVLHFTRRALRHKLSDCKLETVEKYIGIKRDINIPGALVPHFYDTYLRTKNAGPLVAIVEHNKQDLLTLGTLFSSYMRNGTFDRRLHPKHKAHAILQKTNCTYTRNSSARSMLWRARKTPARKHPKLLTNQRHPSLFTSS